MYRRILSLLGFTMLIVAMSIGTAFASTENIGGDLNRDGSLVQYNTWRTHTYAGTISVNLSDNTATYTRLGLRNTAGTQFTNSEQWDALGIKYFHLSSTGSTTIPQGTHFAFNGRMGSTIWPWADNHWGGLLTY